MCLSVLTGNGRHGDRVAALAGGPDRLRRSASVAGCRRDHPALTIFSYRSFEHTLDGIVVERMAAFLNAGVRLGALRPAVGKVFALNDVVEAHRHLEKGLHAGKKIAVTV